MTRAEGPLKIAVICGGSGAVLGLVCQELLKKYPGAKITLIPPASDTGGGFKRVAPGLNMPFPSDADRCVFGLIPSDFRGPELTMLFTGRYDINPDHPLDTVRPSNLLTAFYMTKFGNYQRAVDAISKLFHAVGEVTPMTEGVASIAAEYEDGTIIRNESDIDDPPRGSIQRKARLVRLYQEGPVYINPRAEVALRDADIIILAIGSLYTSLVAALTVPGAVAAIRYAVNCGAQLLYMINTMLEPGQTHDLKTTSAHVEALEQDYILGKGLINHVLIHQNGALDQETLERYARDEAYPVINDIDKLPGIYVWIRDMLVRPGESDYEDSHTAGKKQVNHYVRHSHTRVAEVLDELIYFYQKGVGRRMV